MRADAPPGPAATLVDRLLWALGVSTITQAARELGIAERTARYWLKTDRVPLMTLSEVVARSGVPLEWLITGESQARTVTRRSTLSGGRSLPRAADQVDPAAALLKDTAWPALVVRKSVAAVRSAEEHASVRLNGDQFADAVGIVVQMAAISSTSPATIAANVIGTYVQSGQVKRRREKES